MHNFFDDDYMQINDKSFKFSIVSIIILMLLIASLFLIKKEKKYQNVITFLDLNSACLVTNKKYLNKVKDDKVIFLNDISYEYNVEKIEEKDNIFLVYIKFNLELQNINGNLYQIKLKDESLMEYIIRIMKGI